MKTEELIRALAADTAPEPGVGRVLAAALALGGLATLAAFFLTLGPRPDLAAALTQVVVMLKPVLPLVFGLGAVAAALRSVRPGAAPSRLALAMMGVAALAALAAAGYELVRLPASAWGAAWIGQSIAVCLTMIPLLALPLLAASLYALRRGAPLSPALSGALAGLMSGSIAAVAYSLYCIEDSPLFYATWYSVGIVMVALLGALLGARLLRW